MNRKQRKILEFLSTTNAPDFITQDVISENTKLEQREVGTECYKLREIGFLEPNVTNTGEPVRYRITIRGQIQLDIENDKKIMSRATIILAISTTVLAFGTIGLAFFSGSQTTLMQHDFDVNNRPWIAGFDFRITNDTVLYDIQNYGKIPNTGGTITFSIQNYTITRETFPTLDNQSRALVVMMPTQKFSERFTGKIMDGIKNVREGKADLYFAIMIHYTYGDENFGEYNSIVKYDPAINNFDIMDSWVNSNKS